MAWVKILLLLFCLGFACRGMATKSGNELQVFGENNGSITESNGSTPPLFNITSFDSLEAEDQYEPEEVNLIDFKQQVNIIDFKEELALDTATPVSSSSLETTTAAAVEQVVNPVTTSATVDQVVQRESIRHRLQPGGQEYNYASSAHGAKLVSSNPEAQGAQNILVESEEKYMRNPCSSGNKFVVLELSEETLVDTVVLGNSEYYSSNPREFELFGSMSYPSEDWVSLGRFEAQNVRHAQRFSLPAPRWAKFLKIRFLSHYEQQFYCTLTTVKVFGVDAMEKLLEDMQSSSSEPQSAHQGSGSNVDTVIKLLAEKVKALEAERVTTTTAFKQEIKLLKQQKELLEELLAEQKLSRAMATQETADRQILSFGVALLTVFVCIFVGGSRTSSILTAVSLFLNQLIHL